MRAQKNYLGQMKGSFNIGSEEQVSINQMSAIIENIAGIKLEKIINLINQKEFGDAQVIILLLAKD